MFFFLLSNDQAASIRVDPLCLINLALSNHQDLTKIKSIDRPINSSSISQCMFNLYKCAISNRLCGEWKLKRALQDMEDFFLTVKTT